MRISKTGSNKSKCMPLIMSPKYWSEISQISNKEKCLMLRAKDLQGSMESNSSKQVQRVELTSNNYSSSWRRRSNSAWTNSRKWGFYPTLGQNYTKRTVRKKARVIVVDLYMRAKLGLIF